MEAQNLFHISIPQQLSSSFLFLNPTNTSSINNIIIINNSNTITLLNSSNNEKTTITSNTNNINSTIPNNDKKNLLSPTLTLKRNGYPLRMI
jgi:hypothetical protein